MTNCLLQGIVLSLFKLDEINNGIFMSTLCVSTGGGGEGNCILLRKLLRALHQVPSEQESSKKINEEQTLNYL